MQQRRHGQSRPDGPPSVLHLPDLALLNTLIGHYARLLWGLQRTRVALSHREAVMRRDGLAEQWCLPLDTATRELAATEHAIELQLTHLARQHFLSGWIQEAWGIGLPGFARLLGATGPLDRFATYSRLWRYLGLHVETDGTAPRRRRGQQANWSARGRVVCYQIAVSIVRVRHGRYREAYDSKKANIWHGRGVDRQHARLVRLT